MSEEIKVSVCCLAYNHGKYIRDCLEGFVKQKTNFKFEIIIHEDASTDNTAEIIREYEKKYPELIKPIYQTENQYSKKVGILATKVYPLAKGKYLAYCEGDDYWTDENKLQLQFDIMEAHPEYSMCLHSVRGVKAEDKSFVRLIPSAPEAVEGEISAEKYFDIRFLYNFQLSSFFARTVDVLSYSSERPEYTKALRVGDSPLQMYLILKGRFYFINRVMSDYRCMSASSWSSGYYADSEKQKTHLLGSLEMNRLYAEYIGHKYDCQLNYLELRYYLAIGEYKTALSKKYKKSFKRYYLRKDRIKCFLKAYFPRTMKLLKK